MYNVIYSEPAEDDLFDILAYRAEYDLVSALVFADELRDAFINVLSAHPKAGPVYKDDEILRTFTHSPYTAFYEIYEEVEEIHILRVLDLTKPLEARGINFE